jgi:hypothetical protein
MDKTVEKKSQKLRQIMGLKIIKKLDVAFSCVCFELDSSSFVFIFSVIHLLLHTQKHVYFEIGSFCGNQDRSGPIQNLILILQIFCVSLETVFPFT